MNPKKKMKIYPYAILVVASLVSTDGAHIRKIKNSSSVPQNPQEEQTPEAREGRNTQRTLQHHRKETHHHHHQKETKLTPHSSGVTHFNLGHGKTPPVHHHHSHNSNYETHIVGAKNRTVASFPTMVRTITGKNLTQHLIQDGNI